MTQNGGMISSHTERNIKFTVGATIGRPRNDDENGSSRRRPLRRNVLFIVFRLAATKNLRHNLFYLQSKRSSFSTSIQELNSPFSTAFAQFSTRLWKTVWKRSKFFVENFKIPFRSGLSIVESCFSANCGKASKKCIFLQKF